MPETPTRPLSTLWSCHCPAGRAPQGVCLPLTLSLPSDSRDRDRDGVAGEAQATCTRQALYLLGSTWTLWLHRAPQGPGSGGAASPASLHSGWGLRLCWTLPRGARGRGAREPCTPDLSLCSEFQGHACLSLSRTTSPAGQGWVWAAAGQPSVPRGPQSPLCPQESSVCSMGRGAWQPAVPA